MKIHGRACQHNLNKILEQHNAQTEYLNQLQKKIAQSKPLFEKLKSQVGEAEVKIKSKEQQLALAHANKLYFMQQAKQYSRLNLQISSSFKVRDQKKMSVPKNQLSVPKLNSYQKLMLKVRNQQPPQKPKHAATDLKEQIQQIDKGLQRELHSYHNLKKSLQLRRASLSTYQKRQVPLPKKLEIEPENQNRKTFIQGSLVQRAKALSRQRINNERGRESTWRI